jgi:class 3 adenylate cyclase
MPDFLDLFAAEAPAAGVDLSVGAITVLFSDLTGTTALYEQLGDARAFALVQEHFRDTETVLRRHGGALVKTMGDAVMASFACPGDGLAAAVDMVALVRAAEARHGLEGLSIKIGLHHGPCLAVRANGRLDFFGTTVNLASRLQTAAHANQVVIMAELLAHPEIERQLREGGFGVEHFRAQLKGLRASQSLASIDTRAEAVVTAACAVETSSIMAL